MQLLLRRAILCLTFHANAFVRFVLDERRIKFKTDDEEQLWRFFHRRGGMGRLEMKQARSGGAMQPLARR
jgi:hypothetical protein